VKIAPRPPGKELEVRRPSTAHLLVGAAAVLPLFPSPAGAAVPHTVQPGETLWSIAAANNFTTRTIAAYNRLPEHAEVHVGQTIQIPTEEEGAAALASAPDSLAGVGESSTSGPSVTHTVVRGESLSSIAAANGIPETTLASFNGLSPNALLIIGEKIRIPTPAGTNTASAAGIALGAIPSPFGTMYLRSDAAVAWNAMRQESLNDYGVDLYPEGPLGAYRTYDQQAELYRQYLNGTGARADPPGTSEHNLRIALDLATPEMRSIVDAIGPAFGWAKVTAPKEWWHVTYVGR
jgi:LysM repeat protein